ncbi:14526_t:CDS:2 [Ambispora leptoticha]|uniref:14526_t:CDS:1 n=1 Tax=Ambispora leptoticha TaxID=144679 RepID=A0A9N8VCP4_9GLOM|nr:14526_t:CDS:2 [Ambispora leptoticha]
MANWKNVNNWTTKNCINWTKDYFNTAFKDLSAEHEGTSVKIDEVDNCSGDVDLSNRKGKIITIYDLQLDLRWSGNSPDGTEAKGTINLPEVAHDTSTEDIINVSVDDEDKSKEPIKDVVRQHLVPKIREKLQNFAKDLVENNSKDIYIEPSQLGVATPPRAATPVTAATVESTSNEAEVKTTSKTTKAVVNIAKLTESIEFQTSAELLYETYLDPNRVAIWTRAKPELARHVGGAFSLFGGNITGVFTELIPNQRIAQTWRLNTWPEGHYSNVVLRFDQKSDSTIVHLTHDGVPVGEEDIVRRNWQNYYWNPIKSVFGRTNRSGSNSGNRRRRKSYKSSKESGGGGGAFGFGITVAIVLTAVVLGFVYSTRSTSASSTTTSSSSL